LFTSIDPQYELPTERFERCKVTSSELSDAGGMAKATWQKTTLAESGHTELVEGNHYFPPGSIHAEYFQPSEHTTVCPWKGTAHYYHVVVDGQRNENAAWFYPQPNPAAKNIKDHVAFWKGVQVQS